MGGFFGIASRKDCLLDTFFGTDYHSHLGTRRGGLAAYDPEIGLQRKIHSIENAPFRTKFEHVFQEMQGTSAIGCISDTDPQPLLVRSRLGNYAICIIGVIVFVGLTAYDVQKIKKVATAEDAKKAADAIFGNKD